MERLGRVISRSGSTGSLGIIRGNLSSFTSTYSMYSNKPKNMNRRKEWNFGKRTTTCTKGRPTFTLYRHSYDKELWKNQAIARITTKARWQNLSKKISPSETTTKAKAATKAPSKIVMQHSVILQGKQQQRKPTVIKRHISNNRLEQQHKLKKFANKQQQQQQSTIGY